MLNKIVHSSPILKLPNGSAFIDTNDNGKPGDVMRADDVFQQQEPTLADPGAYRALKMQPGRHDEQELLQVNKYGSVEHQSLDGLAKRVTGNLEAVGYIQVEQSGEMNFIAELPESKPKTGSLWGNVHGFLIHPK